jgi:hypothetical protein
VTAGVFLPFFTRLQPTNFIRKSEVKKKMSFLTYLECDKCKFPVAIPEKDGDNYRLNAGFDRVTPISETASSWTVKCEECGVSNDYNIKNLPIDQRTTEQKLANLQERINELKDNLQEQAKLAKLQKIQSKYNELLARRRNY